MDSSYQVSTTARFLEEREAKALIGQLVTWGVSPEYLINRQGISKELIAWALSELQMPLSEQLSHFVPKTYGSTLERVPNAPANGHYAQSNGPKSRKRSRSPERMPDSEMPPYLRSLPVEPVNGNANGSAATNFNPPYTPEASTSNPTSSSENSQDMAALELKQREVLLARKLARARAQRDALSNGSASNVTSQTDPSAPATSEPPSADMNIDDFLTSAVTDTANVMTRSDTSSSDDLLIEDLVAPQLANKASDMPEGRLVTSTPSSSESDAPVLMRNQATTTTNSRKPSLNISAPSSSSLANQRSQAQMVQTATAVRRPVAFDFDSPSQPFSAPLPFSKRSNSFLLGDAQPKSPLIIDLSDDESEEEEGDTTVKADVNQSEITQVADAVSISTRSEQADLEAKEVEIKRMQDLIAKMERRKKALRANSRLSTPTPMSPASEKTDPAVTPSSAASSQIVSVAKEAIAQLNEERNDILAEQQAVEEVASMQGEVHQPVAIVTGDSAEDGQFT